MTEAIFAGIFGLLIGSFLNVCIYRWPRDLSVVRPRSFCPGCERPIAAYDNIPVLSFVFLRGKCRGCQTAIPARYPLVELLTGLAFFWFVATEGLTPAAIRDCVFSAILIALIFTDLETRLLPDELTLGGILAGLVFAWWVPFEAGVAHWLTALAGATTGAHLLSLEESLLGMVVPAAALWLLAYVYEKVRHREGLGLGDIKMLAAMGAFLGLQGALLALIVGSVLGSVLGLAYIALKRKDMAEYQLPLGTFLGIGGLLACAFGKPVLAWYSGFLA